MPERAQAPRVRSFWSGTITFGLVSIPVDLYSAIRPRETAMKMVDKKGKPLGRQFYCPEDGKKLSSDQIVRGYETESGEMIVITDEELDSVAPEMSRDIDLRRFVPLEQIPPAYYQRPYFLAPSGRSAKAYHLLAATMEKTGRAGIGTFVMRGHEYLVAILSDGGLLRAETLRFAEELRTPEDVGLPNRTKGAKKRVTTLAKGIDQLTEKTLDLEELSDRYAAQIEALVKAKEKKGQDVIDISVGEDDEAEEGGAEVVDLVELLKKRISSKARLTTAADEASTARTSGGGDLQRLSKEALYKRAKVLDISGRSGMGKKALVAAIRKAS